MCHNSYKAEDKLKKEYNLKKKDENNNTYISKENPKITIIYDEYYQTLSKNKNYKTKYKNKVKNNNFNRIKNKSNVEIIYDEYKYYSIFIFK